VSNQNARAEKKACPMAIINGDAIWDEAIKADLLWLQGLPPTPERNHIISVLTRLRDGRKSRCVQRSGRIFRIAVYEQCGEGLIPAAEPEARAAMALVLGDYDGDDTRETGAEGLDADGRNAGDDLGERPATRSDGGTGIGDRS
jgi:hypothetical protein